MHAAFFVALEGKHCDVILQAIELLKVRFCDPNPDESYLRDGPVAVARFEDDDTDTVGEDEEQRNRRILRQRQAADVIGAFLAPF